MLLATTGDWLTGAPSASEHRPDIADRITLRLGLLERRKLVDPADLAGGPADGHHLGIVRHREQPVAGNPRRGDSGKVELPLALPADEVERDHATALAQREYLAIVDHRRGVDVAQRRDAGGDGGCLFIHISEPTRL